MLATGTSLAMVLGLPLGRIIGQYMGWRMTFLIIAIGAIITMVCLMKLLPKLPSEHSGSLSSVPVLFRRPALVSLYLLTACTVTANYTAYSYIEPFMQNVAHMGENFTTFLLLIFGAAGIIGSTLFSLLNHRYPASLLIAAIGLISVCMLLLFLAAASPAWVSVLCVLWGMAMMMIVLLLQIRVLALASDATDVATSLFSGIFNIGIGAGALIGNQVSLHLHVANVAEYFAIFPLGISIRISDT